MKTTTLAVLAVIMSTVVLAGCNKPATDATTEVMTGTETTMTGTETTATTVETTATDATTEVATGTETEAMTGTSAQ